MLTVLTKDKIKLAYSGRIGCMCGCNGKYYTPSDKSTPESVNVSDRDVTRIFNIISKDQNVEEDKDAMCLSTTVGNRSYVVYY